MIRFLGSIALLSLLDVYKRQEVVFQVERNPVTEPSGANAGGKDGDSFHVSGGFAGMPVVVSERTPAGLF